MSRFLARRILEAAPVLIAVSIGAFAILHLVPGDPAQVLLGIHASPAALAALHHELGLDRPLLTQYWRFVRGAATLHFGTSIQYHEPVSSLLARRAIPSLLLLGYSLIVSVIAAVPLAMIAAVFRGRWIDQAIRVLGTVTFVMPSFWLGLVLIELISLRLKLLPASGYGLTTTSHLESLTLPAVTVGLALAPLVLRLLRASMIETLQSEYVEAARARGLGGLRIMSKHVMRNSVTSSVTLLGILAGALFGQTVIVENVFSIPGLGSLFVSSVSDRDFPVVQTLTLLFGLAVVISSIATDVVYALLDPRVRL